MATFRGLGRQLDAVMAQQMTQAQRVAALQALLATKRAASRAVAKVEIRLDRREFDRNYVRANSNMPSAERVAIGHGVAAFTRHLLERSPYDTRRFRRAYAMAANDLGLGPFFVEAVRPSQRAFRRERLANQVQKWQFIVDRYERSNRTQYKGVKRTGPNEGYLRARKIRDRAAKILADFDALDEGARGTALIIGGRKGRGVGQLASLRTRVYGGRGRWVDAPQGVYAQVHNREPHASIVQRNTRVVSEALRAARAVSRTRRVSNAYVRRLAAGTTWVKTA